MKLRKPRPAPLPAHIVEAWTGGERPLPERKPVLRPIGGTR